MSPEEATEMLVHHFRPLREEPSALQLLLDRRADPNAPFEKGFITPLRNVTCFAKVEHVLEMRSMLLQRGATQSKDDLERWHIRLASDAAEAVRLSDRASIEEELHPTYDDSD